MSQRSLRQGRDDRTRTRQIYLIKTHTQKKTMGQAWCKEKSTKAQDSKSPLDRVFLRCAHRIYPALKEEGSVLGGATQRVTSSEIGYASSPPREVLTRGRSIDSVDRPFHPSDWVDVNLEVPGTPRGGSAMTNLTPDTTVHPSTTLASTNSSGSNPRDFAPVPPPRRRRKNRGRPLPPKPDQVPASRVDRATISKRCSKESGASHEHLYSSVKVRDPTRSNRMEIYEHKVNGTGRVIPSTVVAGSRSNREKSRRRGDEDGGTKIIRPKNSSTVSLPNYLELEVSNDDGPGEDEEEPKIRKITAAESLPALVTGGATGKTVEGEDEKMMEGSVEAKDGEDEIGRSLDEVDFSFDVSKTLDTLNHIYKLEGPRVTSTPVKNDFENDSRTPTTVGGWFLHRDRDPRPEECEDRSGEIHREKHDAESSEFFDRAKSSRNDIFFEAEEDLLEESKDNRARVERAVELETGKPRRRTSLKRTLSNESEPFDSYEEKELGGTASAGVRSNSQVKLVGRSISEESLPEEMLVDPDGTSSPETDGRGRELSDDDDAEKKVSSGRAERSDDTKTPPPSPEPKIKPDIFDNDHSTLLKVLRDEAEESNLSSMTPSLTELEAALSDMLERQDDDEWPEKSSGAKERSVPIENVQADKSLEEPIEPKILPIEIDKDDERSGVSVSLRSILGGSDDTGSESKSTERAEGASEMIEIGIRNGDDCSEERRSLGELAADGTRSTATIPTTEPPEKPSRLHQVNLGDTSEALEKVPTPPRRRNRASVGYVGENVRGSRERTAAVDNPYPNDRLI